MGRRFLVVTLAAALLLSGCASTGNPKDPLEGFNRAMFTLNDDLDKIVIKPAAQGYEAVLPTVMGHGVSNFFANIGDIFIAANDALQGKMPDAINDVGRVLVNTTLGVLGFRDVASELGVEKHDEDFGQTFGAWGVGEGAYIVLPFFGPRTVRDSFGLALDLSVDPVSNMYPISDRNTLIVTRVLSDRAQMFPAEKILDEAALDRYTFVRSAYLQRRRNQIFDGNAPRNRNDEE
ncbi:MAG: VacJ family lipoprotein [Sterolibacterium sp.]|nr:VacJ family lipoprotein [Sterolibacterium sp.]